MSAIYKMYMFVSHQLLQIMQMLVIFKSLLFFPSNLNVLLFFRLNTIYSNYCNTYQQTVSEHPTLDDDTSTVKTKLKYKIWNTTKYRVTEGSETCMNTNIYQQVSFPQRDFPVLNTPVWFAFWFLTPLSTMLKLYHADKLYWWMKPDNLINQIGNRSTWRNLPTC